MSKSLEDLTVSHERHRLATYALLAFLIFLSFLVFVLVKTTSYNQASQGYKTNAQEPAVTNTGNTNPFGKSITIERKIDTNVVLVPGSKGTLIINGPFTVEAWIKPKTYPSSGDILGKTQSNSYPLKFMYPFKLSLFNSKPSFSFQDVGSTRPGYPRSVNSPTEIDSNVWHHIAATVDTTTGISRLYVDGLLSGENNANGPLTINDPDRGMVIGALAIMAPNNTAPQPSEFRNHFMGEIDEVRISNTIRYTGDGFVLPHGPSQVDANTLALYHFDESYPFNYYADETGNNNGNPIGYVGQTVSDLNFYLKNESFEAVKNNGQPKVWAGKNLDNGDQADKKNVLKGAGQYSFLFTPAKKGVKQISQTIDHKGQDEAIILYLYRYLKGDLKNNSVGAVIKVQYTDSNGKKSTYSTSKTFTNASPNWAQEKLMLVTDKDKTYDWVRVIIFSSNPKNNSQFRVDNLGLSISGDASKRGLNSTPSSLPPSELQLID